MSSEFVPTEDFIVMTNLLVIREKRPWIDCEFVLYQKLCRNKEYLLDCTLENTKYEMSKLRKERRVTTRSNNI